jgi:hypothetical protein
MALKDRHTGARDTGVGRGDDLAGEGAIRRNCRRLLQPQDVWCFRTVPWFSATLLLGLASYAASSVSNVSGFQVRRCSAILPVRSHRRAHMHDFFVTNKLAIVFMTCFACTSIAMATDDVRGGAGRGAHNPKSPKLKSASSMYAKNPYDRTRSSTPPDAYTSNPYSGANPYAGLNPYKSRGRAGAAASRRGGLRDPHRARTVSGG